MLASIRTPRLTQTMTDITALGSFSVILVITLLAIATLLQFRDRRGVYQILTVFAGTIVIPRLLKTVFARPRPDIVEALAHTADSSFPSGHSFSAAATYLTLALLVSRHRRHLRFHNEFTVACATLILLVGFSRIYLGVHYPTDVLGGIGLGTLWATAVAIFFGRLRRDQAA